MCSPRQESRNVNVSSQTQVFLARGTQNQPITAPPLLNLPSIGFVAELPFTDDVPRPRNQGTLSNGWRIPGMPDLNAEEVRIRYLLALFSLVLGERDRRLGMGRLSAVFVLSEVKVLGQGSAGKMRINGSFNSNGLGLILFN